MECARQLCVGQWLSLANFSWKANRAEQVNICNFGLQAEPGPLQLEGKPRCEQLNILISGNRLSLAHCSWKANLAANGKYFDFWRQAEPGQLQLEGKPTAGSGKYF
jgi:hypothetical protein